MTKIINGDIFIIPNEAGKLREKCNPELYMERMRRVAGIYSGYSDVVVQTWTTSEECDNWWGKQGAFQELIGHKFGTADSPWEQRNQRLLGFFPELLPAWLFEGKKEGDVLILKPQEYRDVEVHLKLSQLNYRYREWGKFEEALNYVMGR